MPAADAGLPFYDQLGPPVRLMREMPAWAAGKTGDPIELANDGVRAEMKKIDVLAKRQVTDARSFFHHQPAGKNPSEPDTARWVDRIAELLLEEGSAEAPRQEKREESEQGFHAAAPSER